MRFPALSAVLAAALFLGATAPSWAICTLCNASVRLDMGLAECYVERSDAELKSLADSGKDFIIVDLKDCVAREGLPTAEQSAPMQLDHVFALDAAGLKCLSMQIAAMDDTKLANGHLFDLTKDCPA